MMSPLASYVARNYAEAKRQHPGEGRRRWRLRAVQLFWNAVSGSGSLRQQVHRHSRRSRAELHSSDRPQDINVSPEVTSVAESDVDPDPLDAVSRDVPGLGLIVRTDFTDEPSWIAFCTRLQDSEKELALEGEEGISEQPHRRDSPGGEQDDGDSGSEDEDAPPAIFHFVNPSSPQERELLVDASNLTILRLFNDVDIRLSPTPPHGAKRISPENRLADKHRWQEIYRGKHVWIYDTKSNTDQCVRVISQSGDMYGTATADSWRARVSHICEIQVNLSLGAIRIDFGRLDRWDIVERSRNMMEAERQ